MCVIKIKKIVGRCQNKKMSDYLGGIDALAGRLNEMTIH